MTTAAETFMREHFARQREISSRSLQAISDMARANSDLIMLTATQQIEKRNKPIEVLLNAKHEEKDDERTA